MVEDRLLTGFNSRLQFEDYFAYNYTRYSPEPQVQEQRVDNWEQSYIQQRLQQRATNQAEDIPEVQRYLTAPVAVIKDQSPIARWKVHASEYPTVARMAREILSIPVTSVPVERLFSSARDILPYRRNRMGHDMITALMVAKSWDRVGAEYEIPDQRGTPAHVEEASAEVDPSHIGVEKRNLRYDADFLRQMVATSCDTQEWQSDGQSDCGSSTEEDELYGDNEDELCSSTPLFYSPSNSFHGGLMSGTSSPTRRKLVDCVAVTPSQSTPRQGGKRRASQSGSLTPTMASRLQKKLRPTRGRNYKV